MSSLLVLIPALGVGIGLATAYGVTHTDRRIHFVEKENLNEELEDLDIRVGHADTCGECGDEIDPDDVGAIVRNNGEYKVICSRPACLDTYDID